MRLRGSGITSYHSCRLHILTIRDCTPRLPRTTRSKTDDPQRLSPTPRPFYESAIADKVMRNDTSASAGSAPIITPLRSLTKSRIF
jgi:hypothetical protein